MTFCHRLWKGIIYHFHLHFDIATLCYDHFHHLSDLILLVLFSYSTIFVFDWSCFISVHLYLSHYGPNEFRAISHPQSHSIDGSECFDASNYDDYYYQTLCNYNYDYEGVELIVHLNKLLHKLAGKSKDAHKILLPAIVEKNPGDDEAI